MKLNATQRNVWKHLFFVLALVLLFSVVPPGASAAWEAPQLPYKSVGYASDELKAYFNEDGSITIEGRTDRGERHVDVTFWYTYAYEETGDPFGSDVSAQADIRPDGTFAIRSGPLHPDYPSYNVSFAYGDGYYYHEPFTLSRRAVDQPKLIERKTKTSIKDAYAALAPTMFDDPFVEPFRAKPPYRSGKLSPAFLNDGLNMVKFVRYVAGLPTDVRLNADDVSTAQHKAVLLEAAYDYADPHNPPKPADMPDSFFEAADSGRETLAFSTFTVSAAVEDFMNDWGDNNRERVGHRDSFLIPSLSGVGFGYTPDYSVTHFSSSGEAPAVEYDYIAWPAVGYFPVEYIPAEMWSIHPDMTKYNFDDLSQIRLTVTNRTTGETQTFANPNARPDRDFFVGSVVTFEPDDIRRDEGDVIEIALQGIKDAAGRETEIRYATKLFSLYEFTVMYNGKELDFSAPPRIEGGTTLVPMRALFEALGASVQWDPAARTIAASSGGTQIVLRLGDAAARVNGRTIRLGAAPTVDAGTTFVPLRFVGEALGAKVDADMERRLITIEK
ncbi:stalk domain-containing protein [Paenibacillus sp.]|uniref:stalk domain-containing protein n=1 Tax=Paenibacillus sp. TaxID=58172 RepID=UPI002D4ED510|nr:stalk domain-containing protein [Paenibacillus sp.]HZG83629.1 stalk domain-containing protein [Paenibacillus sp.]